MSGKALFGWLVRLGPVVWFGLLVFNLSRVNDAMGGMMSQQLMPVMLGAGALALLLSIPLILKLVRLASGTAKPKDKAPGAAAAEDFDPDAVIARYLEKKVTGEANYEVPDAAAPRPVFGRKPA